MRTTYLACVSLFVSFAFALASAGCAADARAPSSRSNAEALASGSGGVGGGTPGYTCDDGFCTCTGDDDCNDMFSDGVCGTGYRSAICQINSAGVPRCRCTMALTAGGSGGVVIGPISAGKIGSVTAK